MNPLLPLAQFVEASKADLSDVHASLAGAVPATDSFPFLPDLIAAVEQVGRRRGCSSRTCAIYVWWARRFVAFHRGRHPAELGEQAVAAYIRHLVLQKKVAAATQNQALQALVFLYKWVLLRPLAVEALRGVRAKRARVLPVALSRQQVTEFLKCSAGDARIVAILQYGSGLRLLEALHLRVADIDIGNRTLVVRSSGSVVGSRTVPIAKIAIEPLVTLLQVRRQQWLIDQKETGIKDHARKPGARPQALMPLKAVIGEAVEPPSPYVFVGTRRRRDPQTGVIVRHHLDAHAVQACYALAFAEAGIEHTADAHILRHSFAVHVLERGHNILLLKTLLGHKDIRTTMRYVQIAVCGPGGVMSPADDMPVTRIPDIYNKAPDFYDA